MKKREKTCHYWPYCGKCQQPFDFDENGPFAYCACGTTEWGYPRPAEWIPKPAAPGDVLVRLKRPEGYEDVHPELILEDARINPAFQPELLRPLTGEQQCLKHP